MPLLGAMCHVGITVSDLDGAMEFFRPFLEFLGYEIWDETRNPNGQRVRVTVNHGNGAVLNLWEAKPEFTKHPFEVYEVGLHHIAFYTDTREQVDRACELAKASVRRSSMVPASSHTAAPTAGTRSISSGPTE